MTGRPSVSPPVGNIPVPEAHVAGMLGGLALEQVRPQKLPVSDATLRVAGWALVGAGAGVVAWSLWAARQVALERPDQLVTSGPYALSRNPMYVGWSLLHLGVALLSRSVWMLIGLVGAWARVHQEILGEERALAETFGGEYDRYRASVPRYIRRPWRPASRTPPRR